jgi:olefin beta-lactone synthetase
MPDCLNIAAALRETAARVPQQRALVFPKRRSPGGRDDYDARTFAQLEQETDLLAAGLQRLGITPGARIVLMVRPGLEFMALVFALYKLGAVVVLIDPGMGPARVFRCLDQVEPEGFIALPIVQALRLARVGRFRQARWNVTVGRRWFWGGPTYRQLVAQGSLGPEKFPIAATKSTDPAAIIFTSGSTGPPKGVVYEHGMFAAQVEALRDYYGIAPGGVDLACFPLFGLFNAALGVTTVVPPMNPTHPARADPEKIVAAIQQHEVTQSFASPAVWKRVGAYCAARGIKLPGLRRVFSAGAPVPIELLAQMSQALANPESEMYTPYGATEALPVCSISAREVLADTAEKTRTGAGTCVGKPLATVKLKIIEMTAGPIRSLAEAKELPAGQVGEIIVQGAVVTRTYFAQPEATSLAKIADGDRFWHRMGDVGYLDDQGRVWFCGRKSHVVETVSGRLFTDRIEPVFNEHPRVRRCALVGIGEKPGQTPVIIVELETGRWSAELENELHLLGKANPGTCGIERFVDYGRPLPVDLRHNVKINREQLTLWATSRQNSILKQGSGRGRP